MTEDLLSEYARLMAPSFLPMPPRRESAPEGDYDVFGVEAAAPVDDELIWGVLRLQYAFPRAVAYTQEDRDGLRVITVYAAKLQ